MKISNKKFIFYASEGFTFQPHSENDLPEAENLQILGWGEGVSAKDAFDCFREENYNWLKGLNFNEVVGMELKSDRKSYFSLKNL